MKFDFNVKTVNKLYKISHELGLLKQIHLFIIIGSKHHQFPDWWVGEALMFTLMFYTKLPHDNLKSTFYTYLPACIVHATYEQ